MRNLALAIGIVVILVTVGFSLLVRGRAQNRGDSKAISESNEVYQGLRNLAFQSTRAKLGLPATSTASTPWGVIMDWGVSKGTATVLALSDGTASIYLSSGGGFIGGAETHESVRNAGKKAVTAAAECQPESLLTKSYPLPERGGVIFYFLTDAGVFTASASQEELSGHRTPLSRLWDSVQDVIGQYRLVQ